MWFVWLLKISMGNFERETWQSCCCCLSFGAYLRVAIASASTLSGSGVRTLRDGEGFPKMFCLVATSLGHLCSQCSIVCGSSLQRGHNGSARSWGDWRRLSAAERDRLPSTAVVVVVVVVVFEASAPKVYPRVTLARASTLSGSEVRTLRGREELEKMSSCNEPGASTQPVVDCLRFLFVKGTQGVCGGVEEIGVGFQQRRVTGWLPELLLDT